MSHESPSRDEMGRLYTTMDAGFKGVHDRLDVLNGRTLKGEIDRENLRTRVVGLEKEVFHNPRRREEDVAPRAHFSKRETGLIALGLGALVGLVKMALLFGEFLVELAKIGFKAK